MARRKFLEKGVWAIAGLFSLLLGIPIVGYVGSALFKRQSEQWLPVRPLEQVNSLEPVYFQVAFKGENAPVEYEDQRGVFVIRRGTEILAFTNVCTHMGCSARWLAWRDQIVCPCHGGMYDRWGILAGGPPAYSLPLYTSKIEDGVVYVANRLVRR